MRLMHPHQLYPIGPSCSAPAVGAAETTELGTPNAWKAKKRKKRRMCGSGCPVAVCMSGTGVYFREQRKLIDRNTVFKTIIQ